MLFVVSAFFLLIQQLLQSNFSGASRGASDADFPCLLNADCLVSETSVVFSGAKKSCFSISVIQPDLLGAKTLQKAC